jgi:hypothetical protein
MKKLIACLVVIFASCVLAASLIRPPSALPRTEEPAAVLAGAHPGADVLSLIQRSCQNCHSSKTEWPLYARIFPFSLVIEHDVQQARSHMNLSQWDRYDDKEKNRILSEIGSVVRNRIMPPRRYTLVHPDAKLSPAEANRIYQWTRAERKMLNRPDGE